MTNLTLPATDAADLSAALHWRYATKRFDPAKRIPEERWEALEEALVLAPSAYGLQPWKFLVVSDPAVRSKLREVSWNQSQVEDADRFVVFAARDRMEMKDIDRFLARVAEVRGVTAESLAGYRDMMAKNLVHGPAAGETGPWSARQTYIALGQFLAAAAVLGVDACPMEGLDPAAYDRILGLEGSGYHTLAACAAGYRSSEDAYASQKKVRFAPEDVIVRI